MNKIYLQYLLPTFTAYCLDCRSCTMPRRPYRSCDYGSELNMHFDTHANLHICQFAYLSICIFVNLHICQFAYLSICIFNFVNCAGIFEITKTLKTTNYIFFEFCQCARNVKDIHFIFRHFCEFTLGECLPIVKTQKYVTITKCIFRDHFA